MPLNPILPLRSSPLVVGVDPSGPGIRALCLIPVTVLEPHFLGADTLMDVRDLQRFWEQVVDPHSWMHEPVVVAVPKSGYTEPVLQWVEAQGLAIETHALVTPTDELELELAPFGLTADFGPAFCAARTAIYRRLGGPIASHLWLEMLRLQDEFELSKRRLRRLMQAQLDTGPEFDLLPF